MQAPIATLAGLLAANLRNLGYALAQVRDQKAAAGAAAPRHALTRPPTTRAADPTTDEGATRMAVLTQDDLLEAIDKMTVLELSEFIKKFEERYGVTRGRPRSPPPRPPAAGGAAAAPRPPRSRPSSPRS